MTTTYDKQPRWVANIPGGRGGTRPPRVRTASTRGPPRMERGASGMQWHAVACSGNDVAIFGAAWWETCQCRNSSMQTNSVISNWPERIKTQLHDDRDNCFLRFDSKAPCGMTVNNDIDDDSATKHGDSHTRNSHRQSV